MCRYSKVADWAYIRACAQATAGALPLIGNGDVVSFEDFHAHLEAAPELATIMLARGALVKPWIFTEVWRRLQQYPACITLKALIMLARGALVKPWICTEV